MDVRAAAAIPLMAELTQRIFTRSTRRMRSAAMAPPAYRVCGVYLHQVGSVAPADAVLGTVRVAHLTSSCRGPALQRRFVGVRWRYPMKADESDGHAACLAERDHPTR